MASFSWEKNSGSGWVAFSSTPTEPNPVESFAVGTWDVRVTVTHDDQTETFTRLDYVVVTLGSEFDGLLLGQA